jgi:hypothetical protein
MSDIVIVDTNVVVCLLNIPGEDVERRKQVIAEYKQCIHRKDFLILPVATIIETGNHVARCSDGWRIAKRFADFVKQTASTPGPSPFPGVSFFDEEDLMAWLSDFPEYAKREIEMADFTMIKECERLRARTDHHVRIWSLDDDLAGYG